MKLNAFRKSTRREPTKEFVDDTHVEFRQVRENERIRLVFFLVTPEIWPSMEPVWRAAVADDRFSALVVILDTSDTDMRLISQSKARALLEQGGVPYLIGDRFSMQSYQPHIAFFPLPYAHLYPERFKPEAVMQNGCRIAYIPYGLEVGGGLFNARYQYDTEIPRLAWRIFARSDGQMASFGRHCLVGNSHVRVTGHPRSQKAQAQVDTPDPDNLKARAQGRPIILWSPHFTVNSRRKWSSFIDHHEAIIRIFEKRQDLFLLVRPHPFLKSALAKHADWGPEKTRSWFADLDARDNMAVDNSTDYQSAFKASSALLSDAGSFLVEYLYTDKPICYLSGDGNIGLNEEVSALDYFHRGSSASLIEDFVAMVQGQDDPKAEARHKALRAYFGPPNRIASQEILDTIATEVNEPGFFDQTGAQPSADHQKAFDYWVKAKSTYLAPPTYYEDQEKTLVDLLETHANGHFAVDIGCGNGRFSEVISRYFDHVEATDPNPNLIEEARENAATKGIANLCYAVERLEHAETLSSYDLVSCMGVLSGLVDEDIFLKSIWKLKAAMLPDARLLLKESLSLATPEAIDWNGYTAMYRNLSAYITAFESAGLELIDERTIYEDKEKGRTNRFFLFKRAGR